MVAPWALVLVLVPLLGISHLSAKGPAPLIGQPVYHFRPPDPEAYSDIQEKYGDRVIAVFIHKTKNVDPARVAGQNLIEESFESAVKLYSLGILDVDATRRVLVSCQADGVDLTDAIHRKYVEGGGPAGTK